MNFDNFRISVGINDTPESWKRHYSSSSAALVKALPSKNEIQTAGKALHFSGDLIGGLIECRDTVENNEVFLRLWNLWQTILFEEYDDPEIYGEQYQEWPLPKQMDESTREIFRVLILTTNYSGMRQKLVNRGLAEFEQYVTANFNGCIDEYRLLTGRYGLSNEKMWWIWSFMLARLFRIGLLEYEIIRFESPYRVYRSSHQEHKLLCFDDGLRFDESGYLSDQGICHGDMIDNGDSLTGYGFDSSGLFEPQKVILPKSKWKVALKQGDYVLNIHIPGDQKMDPASVASSFSEARLFFDKYFPEFDFTALVCYSWLLDLSLKDFLPSKSNILAFQKHFTIVLDEIDTQCVFDYIFHRDVCPIDQLIPVNDFQKKILSFLKQGGFIRHGLGYILL